MIQVLVIIIVIIMIYWISNLCIERMCDYRVNLKLKLQTESKSVLKVYHNKSLSGTVRGGKMKIINIENINYYDRIYFIVDNQGGKGGFIGEVDCSDGQKFYTNKEIFKLIGLKTNSKNSLFPEYSGGKYLGCYQNSNEGLSYKNRVNSVFDCHQKTVDEQYPFYGLQSPGKCLMGYDYLKMKKISDYNCAMIFPDNKDKKYTINNNLGNAVYSTIQIPDIIEIDPRDREPKKQLSSRAKWLWIKGNNINNQYTQGEWKFSFTLTPPEKNKFCADPNYSNFLPIGCSNTTSVNSCRESINSRYINDKKKCLNKIIPLNEITKGTLNTRIMNCLDKIPKNSKIKLHTDFIDNLLKTYQVSCKILDKCESSYCSLLNLSLNTKFNNDCKKTYLGDRKCPNNIDPESQSCSPDSYNCDYLENECKYNNYCWDKFTLKGPKCFLSQHPLSEYIDFRDSKILSAIDMAKLYLETKNINKTLISQFKTSVKQLIKQIKLIEFSDSYNTKCSCNIDDICYPC